MLHYEREIEGGELLCEVHSVCSGRRDSYPTPIPSLPFYMHVSIPLIRFQFLGLESNRIIKHTDKLNNGGIPRHLMYIPPILSSTGGLLRGAILSTYPETGLGYR